MSDITQWSPTDANNNATPPDGFPEGQPASSVNDSARAVMGAARRLAEDGGFFDFGHTYSYVSGTEFQAQNVGADGGQQPYLVGRKVRIEQPSGGPFTNAIAGTIDSISGTVPTINVVIVPDSGTIANDTMDVKVGPKRGGIPIPSGLGTAATEDVGTAIGNVVQLEDVSGSAGLPAVDGSQLTGILAPGIEFLERRVISNDATVDFETAAWFAAPYYSLKFYFDAVETATDGGNFWAKFSTNGGTSYFGGTEYKVVDQGVNGLGAAFQNHYEHDRFGIAGNIETTGVYGVHGWMEAFGFDNRPHFIANAVWRGTVDGAIYGNDVWCYARTVDTGYNAIRFQADSGNLASGAIRVYGIRV